jgi:ubiquinone/menaquinone biosynthesis C-methylase UbiE
MHRTLEPELMEDPEQVKAYAEADFSVPHHDFIQRVQQFVDAGFNGTALDLGCGSGDISLRFVRAYPNSQLHAVDGSAAMLAYAKNACAGEPIRFILGRLPDVILPQPNYDIIFSNSLLHHLPDPQILWQTLKHYARSGTQCAVMDLLRPPSTAVAKAMVACYAGTEPDILQRDFYHSLLAAFRVEEITAQLQAAGLPFNVTQTSDRHVFISGTVP